MVVDRTFDFGSPTDTSTCCSGTHHSLSLTDELPSMSGSRRQGRSGTLELSDKPVRVAPFIGPDTSDRRHASKRDLSPPPSDFWSPMLDRSPLNPFLAGNDFFTPHHHTSLGRSTLGRGTSAGPILPSLPNSPKTEDHEEGSFENLTRDSPPQTFFDKQYFGQNDGMSEARRRFLRAYLGGVLVTIVTMLTLFLLHWGAVPSVPVHALEGMIVDFDSGVVGLNVSLAILNSLDSPSITWNYAPAATYPGGSPSLPDIVRLEKAWVVISVNPDASQILNDGLLFPDPEYDGTLAMTAYINEARSRSVFENVILPQTTAVLDGAILNFAQTLARQVSGTTTVASVLATSPQTLIRPVSYTIENVLPASQDLSSTMASTGGLYLLMASFFIVMFGHRARNRAGFKTQLRLRSLIRLRFISSFVSFFFVSLFYSALTKVLKLNTTKVYGRAGFLVIWMLNWVGMLACGLALEAMVTLIGPCYLPIFAALWAAVNMAACLSPLETISRFYRYGYAVPFYRLSESIKSISLGTKDEVGLSFGVLIVWILISCVSMPLLQRRARSRYQRRFEEEEEMKRIQAEEEPGRASPMTTKRGYTEK